MSEDIPKNIQKKTLECEKMIRAILRLTWRKNYEYLTPILRLGSGRSFGELAA